MSARAPKIHGTGEPWKTIARAQAESRKAKRQRDAWKRRAEEAEALLLEVELAMEVLIPKIKVARWNAMHLNAE